MTAALRAFTRADIDDVCALRRDVIPFTLTTPEYALWRFEAAAPGTRLLTLVAERDSAFAGTLRAWAPVQPAEHGTGVIEIMVPARHRRAGVGTALLGAADTHLRDLGADTAHALVMDDPGRRFAERAGYTARATVRFQALDLSELPPVPAPPQGASLARYSDFADDPRPLHAVESAAMADEPDGSGAMDRDYATWLDRMWGHPLLDRDLSTVALLNGEPAATAAISTDGSTRISSHYTGALRAHRGLGLATYAKTAALHRARDRGFTRAYTDNHVHNAPMLAINTRLGYRPGGWEGVYARAVTPR